MRIKKVIYAVSHVTPGFKQPVKLVMMHALILGKDPDHRNHNTLDNRRENLRKATRAQQGWNRRISKANTTGYKGVCRRNIGDRNWQTTITANGKRIHLGYFYTPEEAAEVYRNAALKLHGEFACFF